MWAPKKQAREVDHNATHKQAHRRTHTCDSRIHVGQHGVVPSQVPLRHCNSTGEALQSRSPANTKQQTATNKNIHNRSRLAKSYTRQGRLLIVVAMRRYEAATTQQAARSPRARQDLCLTLHNVCARDCDVSVAEKLLGEQGPQRFDRVRVPFLKAGENLNPAPTRLHAHTPTSWMRVRAMPRIASAAACVTPSP